MTTKLSVGDEGLNCNLNLSEKEMEVVKDALNFYVRNYNPVTVKDQGLVVIAENMHMILNKFKILQS